MAKERRVFEESIQNLTRELQGLSNEKEGLQKKREIRATRTNDKQIHELQEQLYEARQKAITAQEEVQAKTAQVKQYKKKDDQREEKVVYIKNSYHNSYSQCFPIHSYNIHVQCICTRPDPMLLHFLLKYLGFLWYVPQFCIFPNFCLQLISLDVRNQELVQEMERVRSELLKAKTESENLLKEEKKANQNEMEKVRLELERALKKMSKSEAHDELLKVQLVNNVSQIRA